MSDEHDDDLDEPEESSVIRDLRKKAKRADELDAEVQALRMENALTKAGLGDLSASKQKALLAAHEGETDAEAFRRTAIDLGFITEPAPEPQVSDDEVAAHKRIDQATADAEATDAHPEKLEDRIARTQTAEELDEVLRSAGPIPS